MISPIIQEQIAELNQDGIEVQVEERPDGSMWIRVPNVPLPEGWNKDSCTVAFVAPVGYPQARPDCFFIDPDVRLAAGGMPMNSNVQAAPNGEMLVWFSYHVSQWDPQRDTLAKYLSVCKQRLKDAR